MLTTNVNIKIKNKIKKKVYEHMFDILKFLFPNASDEYLISTGNSFVLIGWFMVSLGAFGFFIESIGQRRLFYEAFPLILFGLFCIEALGMHSNIPYHSFFDFIYQILIPIP